MRFLSRVLPAAVVTAAVVTAASTVLASAAEYAPDSSDYYLALGDSLAVGFQPDQNGVGQTTDQGYVDDVFAQLTSGKGHGKDVRLVKLGCAGETSTTMIDGGICTYPSASSQLDAASSFLSAHRGHVTLVTFNIGSNDLLPCVGATGADLTCIQQSLTTLATNLTTITARLHEADPTVSTRVIGLNYFDPLLASWLQGADGQQLATQSVQLVTQFNQVLQNAYQQAGYRVADVAGAFQITAFSPTVALPGFGDVPTNVATVCQLTWMCAPAPVGPNIHPNAAGYAVIANAVEAQLPQDSDRHGADRR